MKPRDDATLPPRMSWVMFRIGLTLVFVLGAFAALQGPVRRLEASVAASITEWLTGGNLPVFGVDILVFPQNDSFFIAVLTPSCSSLAAVLAMSTLGWLAPDRRRPRRLGALLLASGVIIVGNMVRLVGSLAVGVWFGRIGLIAFHDVVGGTLTFVYILGGYLLMLWALLPKDRVQGVTALDTGRTGAPHGSDRGVMV